jgi:CPA2 family monovalent cation:H+ antiporter-2
MSETGLLRDFVIVFAAALPIVILFHRLQVPSVVGFLMAGIIIGPGGIGLIAHSETVNSIAELGLVLLLFVVGIELSFGQLLRLGRVIIWSGALQVLVTGAVAAMAASVAGAPPALATLIGFLVVHSSTAIVLKVLTDRHEQDSLHGRIVLGILLIQDLTLLPMVLLTRALATPESSSWLSLAAVLLKSAGALVLIIAAARLLLPAVLHQVVRLRSRELFTATIVLVAAGTAWVAAQLDLSLALGALIAGLVISESEYSHAVVSDVLPFRDTLNSVFFISIGMLVPVAVLWGHLGEVIVLTLALLAGKAAIAATVVLPFYRSARVALLTGIALAPLGELAFVLTRFALPSGILSGTQYETFTSVAVLSMLSAPFLMTVLPPLLDRMAHRLFASPEARVADATEQVKVLIIGYGLNGENLARVLRATGLSYLILELNPERVAVARQQDEPVLFGDATRPQVLHQAGAQRAAVVVVAISDALATRRIVAHLRQLGVDTPIIVRTRYVAEIDGLRRLGATEVIPEEFETSVEIFARVLRRLRVPRNVINAQVDLIRREGYRMLRGLELPRETLDQLGAILAATTTESFLVNSDSPASGRTLRDLRLRKETGATVIAIVRGGQPLTNPEPDFVIEAGDILVLVGAHVQLDRAIAVLEARIEEAP